MIGHRVAAIADGRVWRMRANVWRVLRVLLGASTRREAPAGDLLSDDELDRACRALRGQRAEGSTA